MTGPGNLRNVTKKTERRRYVYTEAMTMPAVNSLQWRPTLGGIDSKVEPKMLPILPHHTFPSHMDLHSTAATIVLQYSHYAHFSGTRIHRCYHRAILSLHISQHTTTHVATLLSSLYLSLPTPSAARDSVHTHTYSQPHTVANLSSVSVALSLSHIVPSSGSLMLPKYMQAPKWLPTVQCTPLGTRPLTFSCSLYEKMPPALLTVYPSMLQAKHPAARKLWRPVFVGVH